MGCSKWEKRRVCKNPDLHWIGMPQNQCQLDGARGRSWVIKESDGLPLIPKRNEKD
jgi:hypothetical protein